MNDILIEVESGKSKRLKTANKVCKSDIVISGTGVSDSYYDTFWDAYQSSGERSDYVNAFSGFGWNDGTFSPKYNITPTGPFTGAFKKSDISDLSQKLKDCGVVLDTSKATSLADAFSYTASKSIPPVSFESTATTNNTSVFSYSRIETIELVIINRNTVLSTNAFAGGAYLKEIRFQGEIGRALTIKDSPLLSEASIQNIIDCLVDLTGETAQTLTLHKDVKAKLTEEQISAITSKNWTLA